MYEFLKSILDTRIMYTIIQNVSSGFVHYDIFRSKAGIRILFVFIRLIESKIINDLYFN